jgi:4-hydroxybenzoate polyprenyltransferase
VRDLDGQTVSARKVLRWARLCLEEARPTVQLIFLLRFLAGALLSRPDPAVGLVRMETGMAAWMSATTAVYLFNGVADQHEDVMNGSTRPIASGRLPARSAVAAVGVTALAGLLLAFTLGAGFGLLTACYLVVGYAYSGRPFWFKRTYGAATATGLVLGMATYLAGCLAAGGRGTSDLTAFAVAMSLWMAGVGCIAKDLSDVRGDLAAGRRSWSIVLGESTARRALAVVALSLGVSFVVAAWEQGRLLAPALAVLAGACAVAVASLRGPRRPGRASARHPYRLFMRAQYAAHVALLLSLWLTVRS